MVEKYVDRLPVLTPLTPTIKNNQYTYYEIVMSEVMQKLHRDIPATRVWGYNGGYPGPLVEVRRDEHVKVKWINNLPTEHFLPVDKTIHGAEPENPEVRTVVHLHGGNVPDESDGYPEAWFTRNFEEVGPFFTDAIYDYPNIQPATTLWFHDHALGITRLNVYAGLAGVYYIRDEFEESLNIPKGRYEIALVIQDRSFNEDGSLFYPRQPDPPVPEVDPSIVPEFFGETNLVNGVVWPFLEVEPRKYRFRIVQGANSRFYNLKLDSGEGQAPPSWFQIGTDGGFLEVPAPLSELLLGPGERADIIIDFSNFAGKEIIMRNDARTPFPDGDSVDPNTTGQVMKFIVSLPLSSPDTTEIPSFLRPIDRIDESSARKVRNLALVEGEDEFGRLILLLDGLRWDDKITEKPLFQSVEIWNLINVTVDTHPIHLHLVQFLILDRRPFDIAYYEQTRKIKYTGPAVPPPSNENGWKDTVKSNPGEVTRIIARFGDFTGIYPWHCHILEHEDHEMMRPFKVVKKHVK